MHRPHERVQSPNWHHETGAGKQPPFDQIAPLDLAVRQRFGYFGAVLARIFRVAYTPFIRIFRQPNPIIVIFVTHACVLLRIFSLHRAEKGTFGVEGQRGR
jgi:hypothetical protein